MQPALNISLAGSTDRHKSVLNYFFRDDISEQDNNDFKRNSLSLQSIKLLKHFSLYRKAF